MNRERSEIDKKYQWDLTAIVRDGEEYRKYEAEIETLLKKLNAYGGVLNKNNALEILMLQSGISRIYEKLAVYAHMKSDEDKRAESAQNAASKIDMLGVKLSEAAAFITPSLSELSDAELKEIASKPEAEPFRRMLSQIIEEKPHILSKAEESLLAGVSSFTPDFKNIFMMFDNADIRFGNVTMPDGSEEELSHGTYSLLLQNENRSVRKQAFESVYKTYREHINTIAATYYGLVKKNVFFAKIRKYPSALEKSLFGERIPKAVYDKLVDAVHDGTAVLHDYIRYRKSIFNKLHMYDLYLPLAEGESLKLDYEDAYNVVCEGLKPLGAEYAELLKTARGEGWIDVYENKGKRSGAYSWGEYGSHPYVLLNHQKTPHDVFTIAHELGHAMHSLYSNGAQPYETAGYEIFVAEVASTVNEVLLLKHLLKTAEGETRKFLLAYYLDMFRTTLFRQTMFAEFERYSHDTVEKGEPLTAECLSEEYYALNKLYYGDGVEHDEEIRYEWARIPHFYNAFYVYKYATGITSAVTIASNVLKYGEAYVEKYKNMLKAGGSMDPLDILKLAEVDLSTDAPYRTAMTEFENALKELKELK